MAHCDYNCCAICDRKMAYNAFDPDTKAAVCPECAVEFYALTGRKATTGAQVAAYIRELGEDAVGALKGIGFSECMYPNDVDDAFRAARLTGAMEGDPREASE